MIIQKSVFGEDEKISEESDKYKVKIESFSEDGVYYEVNTKEKTCTCPAYQKRGSICKHIQKVLGIASGNTPVSASLLKSAIQKAIRRGEKDKALKCAKALIELDETQFCRRLMVIIMEDVILHIGMIRLRDIIQRISKKNEFLKDDDKEFLINLIADLVDIEIRDDFICETYKIINKELQEANEYFLNNGGEENCEIGEDERELVNSIKYRSVIGGMGGDIVLLKKYAKLWTYRFHTNKWSATKIREIYPNNNIAYKSVGKVSKSDVMKESVDFHCSPVLNILLKKDYVVSMVKTHYPERDAKEVLMDIMWILRSGVNYKKQIGTGKVRDWFAESEKEYTVEDINIYKDIFSKIEKEVDNISDWFISKQGD